eukprot:6194659-Pyramimonas_sp.AAC.1
MSMEFDGIWRSPRDTDFARNLHAHGPSKHIFMIRDRFCTCASWKHNAHSQPTASRVSAARPAERLPIVSLATRCNLMPV